jgi:DNA-binding NarL/FixJ family response regulator
MTDYGFEKRMIDKLDIERWLGSLTQEQKDICELISDGLNQTEVALAFNVNKMYVSRVVNEIRISYQKYFK